MSVYLGISFAVVGTFGLVSGHPLAGAVFLAFGAALVFLYPSTKDLPS